MLELKHISLSYQGNPAVKDVNLSVQPGEIVGIVGESGSGKSTLIRSIMGLLPSNGTFEEGEVWFEGQNLRLCSVDNLQKIRGRDIAMIFQSAELTMDPLYTIDEIFYESLRMHRRISRREAWRIGRDSLGELLFENPEQVLKSYPFELSGGMCQRVAIGVAMVHSPKLLLADEPTSALDVTVQNQVIELMMEMSRKKGTAILIVSHNMGVVAKMADKVGVMYRGRLIEWGDKAEVLYHPREVYTRNLIQCIPRMPGNWEEIANGK